jgi:RNA polymerase sigma-54 factor
LKDQINIILNDPQELIIAEYLIDSLNDEGLLEQDINAFADDISFNRGLLLEAAAIEKVRDHIKKLEPVGCGCVSIKEYLLIQLAAMEHSESVQKAIMLLENYYDDLAHRNLEKIAHNLQVDTTELKHILQLIGGCRLKPLAESSLPTATTTIIPDFIITEEHGELEISLYHQRSSTLFINQSLTRILENKKSADKGTIQYLKSKLNSAQWFVSAIQQRETTMLNVMRVIVELQAGYFKDGDIRLLKPMILKNVADIAGVDISTVSRITCNKYADTPFGTILLKDLFSEGIENTQGEVISNKVIQTAIEEVVQKEDKKKSLYRSAVGSIVINKRFYHCAQNSCQIQRATPNTCCADASIVGLIFLIII